MKWRLFTNSTWPVTQNRTVTEFVDCGLIFYFSIHPYLRADKVDTAKLFIRLKLSNHHHHHRASLIQEAHTPTQLGNKEQP